MAQSMRASLLTVVFAGLTFAHAPVAADASWPSAKMVRELFAMCLGLADDRARLAYYDGKAQFLALLAAKKRCNAEAMKALAPKMEDAVWTVLKADPSRASDIMAKAQAIAAAADANRIEEACDLSYALAADLGVALD
jgi:hypothetical protein